MQIESRNLSFFKKLTRTVPHDENDTTDTPSVTEHPQESSSHSYSPSVNVPHTTPSTSANPIDDNDPQSNDSKISNDKNHDTDTVPDVPETSTSVPETCLCRHLHKG